MTAPAQVRSSIAALLLATVFGCSGCTLLLPHTPCLIFEGTIRNAHGFGETGRGGNLYRSPGVAYVFNPALSVLHDEGANLVFEVSDPMPGWDTDAGITLILRCAKPSPELSTRSTADGSLTAWLVRDHEYPCPGVREQMGPERPYVPANYESVLTQSGNEPLPAGVHRLVGTIQIRAGHGLPHADGIDLVVFHLSTSDVLLPDEMWLSTNERITAADLKNYPTAPDPREDAAAWAAIRHEGPRPPAVAVISGEFQIEQCIDYSRMP